MVAFLFFIFIVVFGTPFLIFCAGSSRTPWSIFFGVLSNKEFKVLFNILLNSDLVKNPDDIFGASKSYIFHNGEYIWQKNYTGIYYLNGQKLSYIQETKINKLIARKLLKANILTKADNILYSKSNN